MAPKKRISGLYLKPEVVKAVEELRATRRPVPSFNRQVTELIEQALGLRKEGWDGIRRVS